MLHVDLICRLYISIYKVPVVGTFSLNIHAALRPAAQQKAVGRSVSHQNTGGIPISDLWGVANDVVVPFLQPVGMAKQHISPSAIDSSCNGTVRWHKHEGVCAGPLHHYLGGGICVWIPSTPVASSFIFQARGSGQRGGGGSEIRWAIR